MKGTFCPGLSPDLGAQRAGRMTTFSREANGEYKRGWFSFSLSLRASNCYSMLPAVTICSQILKSQ